jgi:hypothetical protein
MSDLTIMLTGLVCFVAGGVLGYILALLSDRRGEGWNG